MRLFVGRSAWAGALLCIAWLLLGCSEELIEAPPVTRPVKVHVVPSVGSRRLLEYPGEVRPTQNVDMAFEVQGRILELPVLEGQRVEEGALLAQLDVREYANRLAASRARRNRARVLRDRVAEAAATGAVSQQELSDAQARFDAADAEARTHQKRVEDATLRAPFSGIVARKLVDPFQNVQAKQPVITFQDISSLELKVSVPESDLARNRENRSHDFTPEEFTELVKPQVILSSLPDERFPARMTELATTADPVTRTFRATFAFDNPPDFAVLPGMTAKVVIVEPGDPVSSGFAVPAAGVLADEAGSYVWRLDGELRAQRTSVQVGELGDATVRVLSGLSPGDRIAISGVHQLREGMEVRILEN